MTWSSILDMLELEIRQLGGEDVVMQLEVASEDRDIRNDGTMRADARLAGPAVILEFTASKIEGGPRLSYPCDTYRLWWHNVHGIAGALNGLRSVERYGVKTGGRQYQGFKALPAKTSTTMTVEKAAEILAQQSGSHQAINIVASRPIFLKAVRAARAKAHPDRNAGRTDLWDAVERAREKLDAHHNGR
jgi:hypothetical protein